MLSSSRSSTNTRLYSALSAALVGQHPHLSEEYEFDEVDAFAEFQHGFDGNLWTEAKTDVTTSALHVCVVDESQ